MTFIDLFAGVGGFRKGLELAGHKCLGFCEYDKFAVQSYRAIHETEGEWYARDIREVRADDIPGADMWCAGFPCQDISVAGKQLGFKGKRSSLFFTVTSLVADLEEKDRPAVLLFENVKNLLSINRGFDFARLLIELDEIGYDAEWALINSADVVPQNRERVFIVGHLRDRDRQQVFPIRQSNEQDFELQRCKAGTITTRTGTANAVGTYVVESQKHAQKAIGGLCCSRTLKANNHDACVAIKQIGQLYGTEKEPNPQAGRVYDKNGISPSLDTCQGGNRMPKIATSDIQVRKLTPLECWRLQGWQDEDFFKAFFLDKELGVRFSRIYHKHIHNPVRLMQWAFKHQKMSDSQLYKQAGNGVTVTVIQRIGEKL